MSPGREWKLVDGRPDPDQLAGVIAPIVQEIQPDLVILFGSAARGTMTADSDVDLVVVKDAADLRGLAARSRGCVPEPHPPLDIVPATRELLHNHRDALSWIYGPAMAHGVVAYERGIRRSTPWRRASDALPCRESLEDRMVRTFRYQREEMRSWLEKARKDMTGVESKDADLDPDVRCYLAQAAAEKVLKALLVAHGKPVRAEHDLAALAREVRQAGEPLPDVAADHQLKRLSEYGGPAQYPGWEGETADEDVRCFSDIARRLYDHARSRAPEILDRRRPE